VEDLIAEIRKEFPSIPLVLRPKLWQYDVKEWCALADEFKISYSNSKIEISFDFLKRVDLIISGDSTILLEAALMNVLPLCYDYARISLDYYDYIRNGLVRTFSEPEELCLYIKTVMNDKPYVRDKAKRYCATIDTCHDGRSSDLAIELIEALLFNNQDLGKVWIKDANCKLDVYRHVAHISHSTCHVSQ
jgi:predicted glycosyltransferase